MSYLQVTHYQEFIIKVKSEREKREYFIYFTLLAITGRDSDFIAEFNIYWSFKMTTLIVPSLASFTCLNASKASLNWYLLVIRLFKSTFFDSNISIAVG